MDCQMDTRCRWSVKNDKSGEGKRMGDKEMVCIADEIGRPALLEGLAEEAAELAKAALKLSRKLRGENPTPMTEKECILNLTEEIADIELYIGQLVGDVVDRKELEGIRGIKHLRWISRLLSERAKRMMEG